MQKWEYMEVYREWDPATMTHPWPDDLTDKRSLEERLNAWGQEGWELAVILEDDLGVQTIYLKRPIE